MSLQSAAFLQFCGDMWFDTNRPDLGRVDPVSEIMFDSLYPSKPRRVFEVGCSNGWRLKKIKDRYGCWVGGLDPSKKAIAAGEVDNLTVGLAHEVHTCCEPVDTLIYGFCWSFIGPEDYFAVLTSGDLLLEDGGYLFLHDRVAPYPATRTYANIDGTKGEKAQVMMYEMDFTRLWTAHPHYTQVAKLLFPDRREAVYVLRKNIDGAFTPYVDRNVVEVNLGEMVQDFIECNSGYEDGAKHRAAMADQLRALANTIEKAPP